MRRALTLIELILSMVIIAIVFTVIPRLIHAMNQTSKTAQQEEAMYNAVALMGAIINLPWDHNNTQHDQILQVTAGNNGYDCNMTSGYRIGGFIGGRNCREENGTIFTASSIGQEDEDYNDMDDYDKNITTTHSSCSAMLYDLNTTVQYLSDDGTALAIGQTTNTKTIGIKVKYNSGHKLGQTTPCITNLNYTAYNIGQIHINSRSW